MVQVNCCYDSSSPTAASYQVTSVTHVTYGVLQSPVTPWLSETVQRSTESRLFGRPGLTGLESSQVPGPCMYVPVLGCQVRCR